MNKYIMTNNFSELAEKTHMPKITPNISLNISST